MPNLANNFKKVKIKKLKKANVENSKIFQSKSAKKKMP
jgi:hypothetical protein